MMDFKSHARTLGKFLVAVIRGNFLQPSSCGFDFFFVGARQLGFVLDATFLDTLVAGT